MLKKIVIMSFGLMILTQINARGGSLPSSSYTDKHGCLHQVDESWENQSSYTVDTIVSCPKNPDKVGNQIITKSNGRTKQQETFTNVDLDGLGVGRKEFSK